MSNAREEIVLDWSMINAGDDEYTIEISPDERYRVEFKIDEDSTPGDTNCYDESDLQAWREDRWWYIGVIVTPLHVPDRMQFELSDSLWGLEFDFVMENPVEVNGRTYTRTGEDYQLLVYPVPDMIGNVRANVARWNLKAATESYGYS